MKYKTAAIQLLILVSLWVCSLPSAAQTDTTRQVKVDAGVDLVSRYIWRGLELSKGPCIQPQLSASWKDFSIGSWGSYSLTGDGNQETDFFVSKTIGFVTLAVWDYWSTNPGSVYDFFDYKDQTTNHLLEGQFVLSGGDRLPLNLVTAYFFYGSDPSRSLYFELQYVPKIPVADLMVFAGYQAKGTSYADKPSFVNVGCTVAKSITITDHFSLPLSLSLVCNPAGKKAWLVAGITL